MEPSITILPQPVKKTRGRKKKIITIPTLVIQHGTFYVHFD